MEPLCAVADLQLGCSMPLLYCTFEEGREEETGDSRTRREWGCTRREGEWGWNGAEVGDFRTRREWVCPPHQTGDGNGGCSRTRREWGCSAFQARCCLVVSSAVWCCCLGFRVCGILCCFVLLLGGLFCCTLLFGRFPCAVNNTGVPFITVWSNS